MNSSSILMGSKTHMDNICIVDSATTHSIFKDVKYFSLLHMGESNVTTISDNIKIIEGSEKAQILLPREQKLQ